MEGDRRSPAVWFYSLFSLLLAAVGVVLALYKEYAATCLILLAALASVAWANWKAGNI